MKTTIILKDQTLTRCLITVIWITIETIDH